MSDRLEHRRDSTAMGRDRKVSLPSILPEDIFESFTETEVSGVVGLAELRIVKEILFGKPLLEAKPEEGFSNFGFGGAAVAGVKTQCFAEFLRLSVHVKLQRPLSDWTLISPP